MAHSIDSLGRRQFIKGAGLAGMATAFGSSATAVNAISEDSGRGRVAKNLIFLVVDGMGTGTLSLGHHWSLRNLGKPLNWTDLYRYPDIKLALQDTASASSPVTDSAAAASAWGSGQRVMNGSINTNAQGVSLAPLYSYAKAAGKATGLVSTCRITHATPAGFVANVADRDAEDTIAQQYLEREVDVLLGGGRRHFERSASLEGPRMDLIAEFKSKGYAYARNKAELSRAGKAQCLLGLFAESHIPYAIDRKNTASLAQIPDLPTLFRAALERLSMSEEGFVLQVEAGRVDHAGHVNDPAAILHELLEFDRCIPIALEYLSKDPNTLVIVTTDHGTGGCQLNGVGDAYNDSGPALEHINQATASFESLEAEFMESGQFDRQRFVEATGIIPTEAHAKKIQTSLKAQEVEYLSSTMTRIISDVMLQVTGIGWTSNNHTAELVDCFAIGPGAERLEPLIDNNVLFAVMKQALDI